MTGETTDAIAMDERETRGAIPHPVKVQVQARDRFHCRFTGMRLVDPEVFRLVAQLSTEFLFDPHHSVKATARGRGGHPMVRTHGAAYEHSVPLACGGTNSADNIVLTSVELNEAKNTRILPLIPVPDAVWDGLRSYLPKLRALCTGTTPRPSQRHAQAATSPLPNPETVEAHGQTIERPRFDAAFNAFWASLEEQYAAREVIIFEPIKGNPRRVRHMTSNEICLVETTDRGGSSVCTRQELRGDFWKLANDRAWRSDSLIAVRQRHNIRNFVEFKRKMYERFEPFLVGS